MPDLSVLAASSALTVSSESSAQVTDWGPRIFWTALVLLAVVAMYGLMWRGWRARGRRQADLPAPPEAPPTGPTTVGPVEAVYVSSTTEGDWLNRVVAHGLGVRAQAQVSLEADGLRIDREGASTVWLPAETITGVRLAPGMAGKFVGEGGLLVITWELGAASLDTGLRTRYAEDRDALLAGLGAIVRDRSRL